MQLSLLECAIRNETYVDPVVLSTSGRTYCRARITQWLEAGHGTCPLTNMPASMAAVVPNFDVGAVRDVTPGAYVAGARMGRDGAASWCLVSAMHSMHTVACSS
jgi:hypothetical protein